MSTKDTRMETVRHAPIHIHFFAHKKKNTYNPFVLFANWCYMKATPMYSHVCIYNPQQQYYYSYDTAGYGIYKYASYGKDSHVNSKHLAYILNAEAMLEWEKYYESRPAKENLWIKTKLVASYLLPFLKIKNCSSVVAEAIGIKQYINTPAKLERHLRRY